VSVLEQDFLRSSGEIIVVDDRFDGIARREIVKVRAARALLAKNGDRRRPLMPVFLNAGRDRRIPGRR